MTLNIMLRYADSFIFGAGARARYIFDIFSISRASPRFSFTSAALGNSEAKDEYTLFLHVLGMACSMLSGYVYATVRFHKVTCAGYIDSKIGAWLAPLLISHNTGRSLMRFPHLVNRLPLHARGNAPSDCFSRLTLTLYFRVFADARRRLRMPRAGRRLPPSCAPPLAMG